MNDEDLKRLAEQEISDIQGLLDSYADDSDMSDLNTRVESLCSALQEMPVEMAKSFTLTLEKIHAKVRKLTESIHEQVQSTEEELKVLHNRKKASQSYDNFSDNDD